MEEVFPYFLSLCHRYNKWVCGYYLDGKVQIIIKKTLLYYARNVFFFSLSD